MKGRGVSIVFLLLTLISCVFANPASTNIDSEIQKLTYYAQEYEVGNIDYIQLMIHVSAVRESMNEILGVTNKEMGGVVKQDQIKKILGEPTEETKWVWVEGEDREKKLDNYVPIWKKIVFDGKKIQIRMEAYPSIFSRKKFDKEDMDEKFFQSDIEEGSVIYRLHFNTEFKRPQDQLDINGKINDIKLIAENFNEDPTNANAENLAKQSVNAERIFQNYFQQGQGNCEDIMISIFGSENQRQTQKILSNEFTFFEGENFEAIMRLEMCDECEWNYINLNMWINSRGKFNQIEEGPVDTKQDKSRFKQMTDSEFKAEVKKIIEDMKENLELGQYGKAQQASRTLNTLNNAWSESSNNAWEEVRKDFESKMKLMSDEERYEFDQNYGWIKQDQEQRQKVKEIQKQKYEERKSFYLDLFSEYDMKELYFTQTDFEKRLVEEFKERGEEICNNNQDDNENEQIDCEESQCGGKICGTGMQAITDGNTTEEVKVDFYCIQSVCQAKENDTTSAEPICGNHICEEEEADTSTQNGTCQSDCIYAQCPKHDAIKCLGKVIFEGEDENGCQLPPICIEETEVCETTEDCMQPSCGISECIEKNCKVTELKECTSECELWEQEVEICDNKKIITKICEDGQWKKTGSKCESESSCVKCGDGCIIKEESAVVSCEQSTEDFKCESHDGKCVVVKQDFPEPMPIEPILGIECIMASDCGGEDDVCSNGKCIQIPKVIKDIQEEESKQEEQEEPEKQEEQKQESQEEPEEKQQESVEESLGSTGVFGFFNVLLNRLTITGKVVDGEATSDESTSEPEESQDKESPQEPEESPQEPEGPAQEPEKNEDMGDDSVREEPRDDFKDSEEEWEEKNREEQERREEENRERCEKDCARPCVEKCIRATCGDAMECDIDAESKICERSCIPDESCIEKCASGVENWWEEFQNEDMNKQEKGVFQVGGGCREERGKTNGYIWFGGWGDPFERVQGLKEQYYTGGEADWCKQDLENLIRQREEFEKGFNQEFAQWFFEKYLPSSAENWEQAQSGIYEVYWNNVDMQRQFAERMGCVKKNNIEDIMDINLINIEYETEFGKLEYWEEIKEVQMDWTDEKVTIISPYMKVWIFPSEEFIKYEMKTSMEEGEFPGSPQEKAERKNQEGLTEEEKEIIKQNSKFMELIEDIADEYNGNAEVAFQIVDEEEIIFNLYVQVNKENIMEIEPMSPEKLPAQDITIKLDFKKIYDLINFEEKEMRGAALESPPWDQQPRYGAVKGITDGIQMYFKVRSIINSAEVSPSSAEGDARDLMMSFLKIMGDKDGGDKQEEDFMEKENEGGEQQEESKVTGKVTKPAFKF